MMPIDLRRDTITLPSEEMKEKAFQASLGDSVYGEDPNQAALEETAARLLGKEAALFVPSGTMGNLIALLTHTRRGEEVILEENAHIRLSETGGLAAVAGLMVRGLFGADGIPEPEAVLAVLRPDDIHYPRTSLLCIENTHYRYGGIVPPLEKMREIYELSRRHQLAVHLDGARLWNAAVYLGIHPSFLARYADSVMVSLSKGLGAPIGSLLAGSEAFIREARRYRKMLGGGMRQTGWLCACGLIAISGENIARLQDDHRHARLLAEGLAVLDNITVDLTRIQTNFVLVDCSALPVKAPEITRKFAGKGVLVTPAGEHRIRLVTSSRVGTGDVRQALSIMEAFFRGFSGKTL
ncbi:MAG TPA: GntG family PLP-dependent aldolase [Atribacteraceae bacterium]|nr:GntG family PLP-dependent aldolase [Atribacteraceae bacterium]